VTAPSVTFRPSSGIREIEPNVDYAVALTRMFLDNEAFRRPLKATWVHGMALVIEDPMAPKDQMRVGGFDAEVVVLGRWNDPMEKGPLGDGTRQTWQGYAAQQLGEVLRQNDLAERLTAYGIPREPETYLLQKNTANAVSRSLTLTYDELNRLLTDAGYPPVSSVFRD
jgi:hypothetical protein